MIGRWPWLLGQWLPHEGWRGEVRALLRELDPGAGDGAGMAWWPMLAGQFAGVVGLLVGIRLLSEVVEPAVFGQTHLLAGVLVLATGLGVRPYAEAMRRMYSTLAGQGRLHRLRASVVEGGVRRAAVLSVLVLIAGAPLSWHFQVQYVCFVLLAVGVWLESWTLLEMSLLTAGGRGRALACWSGLEGALRPLMGVLLAWSWSPTPQGVLLGYTLATGLGLLGFRLLQTPVAYRPTVRVRFEGPTEDADPRLERELATAARAHAPLALMSWLGLWQDRYLLHALLSAGVVGPYAAAYQAVSRPMLVAGSALERRWCVPYREQQRSGGKAEQGRRVFWAWLLSVGGISVVVVSLLVWQGEAVAWALVSERYRDQVASVLPWLAAGYFFLNLRGVLEAGLEVRRRTGMILAAQAQAAVFGVCCVWFLGQAFGLVGVAVACAMFLGFSALITAVFLRLSQW